MAGPIKGFVKFLTMIPRLIVMGATKVFTEPMKVLATIPRDAVKIPGVTVAVFKAAFRKISPF